MASLPLLGPVQQAAKMAAERAELCRGYLPNDGVVNSEVIVDEPISHLCNLLPLHVRLQLAELLWNLLRGFSDDLQAADECSL
jgi:hypothetical protein